MSSAQYPFPGMLVTLLALLMPVTSMGTVLQDNPLQLSGPTDVPLPS
jgi:hypothetical protein